MKKILLLLSMICVPALDAATRIEAIMQVGDEQAREEFVLQVGETIQLGEGVLVVQGTVVAEEADRVVGEVVVFVRDENGNMQAVGKDTLVAQWDVALIIEFPINDQLATLTVIAHRE
jgi:hypothetical protein